MRHPTHKETAVLRLLTGKPKGLFGLEIVAESEGAISKGSVYFILDRLEEAKWVEARSEAPPLGYGGKPRHIFCITALGQEVLEHEERFAAINDPDSRWST